MDQRKQKILLIEKYPVMVSMFKVQLLQYATMPFQIKVVGSVTEANQLFKGDVKYDVVIISSDYAIQDEGVSEERFLTTIKSRDSICKLMLLGNNANQFKVQRTINKFQPNVFLWKQEVNMAMLAKSIQSLWGNTVFYSPTISVQNEKHSLNEITIDTTDVDLIFHLVKNSKTKDLPSKLNLSLGAIEKRKNRLKQKLNTQNLLLTAYEKGLV